MQIEIERRKEEIFKEYQKRNSGVQNQKDDPRNKKIRIEYEQSLKANKSPSNKPASSRKTDTYDPYRQNYKHKASKDVKQLDVVGDPLMHEYDYHKNVGKIAAMEVEQDHEIFTKSGTVLKNK